MRPFKVAGYTSLTIMCFLSIFFAVSIQRQQTITNEMSGFTSKNYPARKNFEMFTLDIGNNMKIECMSAA